MHAFYKIFPATSYENSRDFEEKKLFERQKFNVLNTSKKNTSKILELVAHN